MNPYFLARLADDHAARIPVAGGAPLLAPATVGAATAAGRPAPRRVCRAAGWLLVEAGLRLALGRRPGAVTG